MTEARFLLLFFDDLADGYPGFIWPPMTPRCLSWFSYSYLRAGFTPIVLSTEFSMLGDPDWRPGERDRHCILWRCANAKLLEFYDLTEFVFISLV